MLMVSVVFEITEALHVSRCIGNLYRQCWKFLSPSRPRLPVLGLGYLLPEAGSPGWRPEIMISQLLEGLQHSITQNGNSSSTRALYF